MRIESGLSKTAFSVDAPLVTEAHSLYQTYLYNIERGKEKECERQGGWEEGREEQRKEGGMDDTKKASK